MLAGYGSKIRIQDGNTDKFKVEKGGSPWGNVRPLNRKKYGISKNRFWELYYWCLQYNEWRDELKYKTDAVKSIEVTDMPVAHENGDSTQELAIRRAQLEQNCKIIEQTVLEADSEIYQYLLKAVTDENVTYRYLKLVMGIPCGKKMYYDRRRKFYWLLNQKKIF